MKKRILSILLSLVMVLTLTPVSAFAGSQSVTFDVTLNVGSNVTLKKVIAIFPGAPDAAITIVKGNVTGGVRTGELSIGNGSKIDKKKSAVWTMFILLWLLRTQMARTIIIPTAARSIMMKTQKRTHARFIA